MIPATFISGLEASLVQFIERHRERDLAAELGCKRLKTCDFLWRDHRENGILIGWEEFAKLGVEARKTAIHSRQ